MSIPLRPSAPTSTERSTRSRPPGRQRWSGVTLAAVALGAFLLGASVVAAATGGASAPDSGTAAIASHQSAAAPAPTVTAQAERTMQGAKLSLRGEGWPARTRLTITATAPPGASAPLDLGTSMSNADGEFRATKLSPCTTTEPTSATVSITVAAGSVSAKAQLDASAWVCMKQ